MHRLSEQLSFNDFLHEEDEQKFITVKIELHFKFQPKPFWKCHQFEKKHEKNLLWSIILSKWKNENFEHVIFKNLSCWSLETIKVWFALQTVGQIKLTVFCHTHDKSFIELFIKKLKLLYK